MTTLPKIVSSLLVYERNFFPSHLAVQLKHLYLANAIFTFAASAGAVFEALYLYTIGYALWQIMLFYAAVYAVYIGIMPLGGKVVKHFGFEHGMMYGSICSIFYYLGLFLLPASPAFLPACAIILALSKTLFWPGYHADVALFGQDGERGRELSNIAILASAMSVVGPLVSGAVVALYGFSVYFVLLSCVMVVSNIPFLLARETFAPSDFSYKDAYKNFVHPSHRKYLLGYLGFGEEIILVTVWPILLYLTLNTFWGAGIAIAASTAATALVLLYVGRETDMSDRSSILRIGAVFTVFAWVLRLAARSGGSILLVDFATRTSKGILSLPLLTGLYEYAHRTSVVQSAIFFEMSVAFGKMIVALLLAGIFAVSPDGWFFAFLVGTAFSCLYLFLTEKHRHGYVPARVR